MNSMLKRETDRGNSAKWRVEAVVSIISLISSLVVVVFMMVRGHS